MYPKNPEGARVMNALASVRLQNIQIYLSGI